MELHFPIFKKSLEIIYFFKKRMPHWILKKSVMRNKFLFWNGLRCTRLAMWRRGGLGIEVPGSNQVLVMSSGKRAKSPNDLGSTIYINR